MSEQHPEILYNDDGLPMWLRHDLAATPREAFRYVWEECSDIILDADYLEFRWTEDGEDCYLSLESYRRAIEKIIPITVMKHTIETIDVPESFDGDFPYYRVAGQPGALLYWKVLEDI